AVAIGDELRDERLPPLPCELEDIDVLRPLDRPFDDDRKRDLLRGPEAIVRLLLLDDWRLRLDEQRMRLRLAGRRHDDERDVRVGGLVGFLLFLGAGDRSDREDEEEGESSHESFRSVRADGRSLARTRKRGHTRAMVVSIIDGYRPHESESSFIGYCRRPGRPS